MIGEDCPRNYAYPAHNYDRRVDGRVALDPSQGVALAQPARSSGREADGQTLSLAASGRAQFATPLWLAICERHGVAWPKAARRAVPLWGSRGRKRCASLRQALDWRNLARREMYR